MDAKLAILQEVKPGDELVLLFDPDVVNDDGLVYVVDLLDDGVLTALPGTLALIAAIRMTGDWDGDFNRSMRFAAGPNWDPEVFEKQLDWALEATPQVQE